MTNHVEFYVDGSANGTKGAFAVQTYYNDQLIRTQTYKCDATSNACEMLALGKALHDSGRIKGGRISIYSDSKYVVDGVNGLTNLKANQSLWDVLHTMEKHSPATIHHVKAHDKNERNNRVDKIARHTMRHYHP